MFVRRTASPLRPGRVAPLAILFALAVAPAAAADTPAVWPAPQSVSERPETVTVPGSAGLVVGERTDQAALRTVKEVLANAGVDHLVTARADEPRPRTPLTVYVGGPGESPATAEALDALRAEGPEGLPDGGYVTAVGRSGGRSLIALSGADPTGTFYAAQTLRQLVVTRDDTSKIGGVVVRDWPAMALRGVIEGFYGQPWSTEDRLRQLDFYGRTKQNIYVYSPKDDAYLRAKWRDPYPSDQLAVIERLVDRALANHVKFTYALSPGLSVCYSSDADERALVDKFESLYAIGVRTFAIPLDDISYTSWNCPEDAARFGSGGGAAGRAQAYLLNRVQHDFVETHPDLDRLQMVPTEYYNVSDSPYKTALRQELDPAVIAEWTGVGVIAPQITQSQAAQARQVFGHDILVWDNYPVNDYITDRLLLGPYVGREPGIAGELAGVTANPMVQAEASKIAEFTSGDFLWNPRAYDPDAAWLAALHDLAGPAFDALKVFAENNYAGVLARLDSGAKDQDSPVLRPLIASYWAARAGDGGDLGQAADALETYFGRMAAAPGELRSGMAGNPAFLDEVGPWLDELALYGQAGQHAVRMLAAERAGDGETGWSERRQLQELMDRAAAVTVQTASGPKRPKVCIGVCEPFLDEALAADDRWLGVGGARVTPTTSMGTWSDNAPARMVDGDLSTFYWSDRAPLPGDSVGVDLGSVQAVSSVRIAMSKPSSPNDYIHHGALEYSADGTHWTQAATYDDQPEIAADLPAGTHARYVRLRATAAQDFWVVVRELSVTTPERTSLSVSGAPAPASGSRLAAAADGDPSTVYTAGAAPAAGDALTVTASTVRPLDRVVVLQSGSPAARAQVQVRAGDGAWRTIGSLDGGYTELDAGGVQADQIRLAWEDGSAAPRIAEVIPWYADEPPAAVSVTPAALDLEAGGDPATVTVTVAATRARDTDGTLTVDAGDGVAADPSSRSLTLHRGEAVTVPVRLSADAAARGQRDVRVTFAAAGGGEGASATLAVSVYPRTSDTNVALSGGGALASASCREVPDRFGPELANDGDASTRWSSCYDDGAWWQVELPAAAEIGKVVIRWEAAYGRAYDLQVSSDGQSWRTVASVTDGDGGTDTLRFDAADVRFVRMQGVRRATQYGYSIYELEAYPVS